MRVRIFYFACMKTGKNCSCAVISCNSSQSRSAAKNQNNFAGKKNLLDGTLLSRGEHCWEKDVWKPCSD